MIVSTKTMMLGDWKKPTVVRIESRKLQIDDYRVSLCVDGDIIMSREYTLEDADAQFDALLRMVNALAEGREIVERNPQ